MSIGPNPDHYPSVLPKIAGPAGCSSPQLITIWDGDIPMDAYESIPISVTCQAKYLEYSNIYIYITYTVYIYIVGYIMLYTCSMNIPLYPHCCWIMVNHPHLQHCHSLPKLASCEAARRSCATRSTGRAMALDQAMISSTSWRTWRGEESHCIG